MKQLSVFVQNERGRLAALTKLLADHGIDLLALSIADTSSFGILRAIVNDPAKAVQVLREAHATVSLTEVLAVKVPDSPGGLAGALALLEQESISVEYLYSFVRNSDGQAVILFKVEALERAKEALREKGYTLIEE